MKKKHKKNNKAQLNEIEEKSSKYNSEEPSVHEQILERLEKLTSFKFQFLGGVVRGVGTAIGATIIAAIALTTFARVVDSVEDVPILKELIQELNINEILDSNVSSPTENLEN